MFDIGAPEFLLLIVAAVILFGPEKLPEFARKAARVVNYVRNIAGNAQSQLGKELRPGRPRREGGLRMTPMLLDINGPEFALLLVLAVILFGPERLPDLARKAARIVNYLRNVAGTAQEQLSKELGPGFENLDVRDLNPRSFIQKHLLDDVQPILADVKGELTDVKSIGQTASADVSQAITSVKDMSPGGPADVMAAATPSRVLTPFDSDAT
jgi:sec-independent protein translocase protein TatB